VDGSRRLRPAKNVTIANTVDIKAMANIETQPVRLVGKEGTLRAITPEKTTAAEIITTAGDDIKRIYHGRYYCEKDTQELSSPVYSYYKEGSGKGKGKGCDL
jgi:hypothetical protein